MKIAVIGAGRLGSIHLRIYKELKGIRKIYLADTDKNILANHKNIETLSDYRKLAGKINLVSIATPTSSHFKIAKFFLERKIPVLVEKPLTKNLAEAKKLLAISKKNKALLFVGHVERYNSAYLAVKNLIKNPVFIECHRLSPYPNRSLDVSVVLDLMIHDLDIILNLVKDKVKGVLAKGVRVLSASPDIVNARIEFTNGCVANITSSRISAKKERKIRVFMPNAYLSIDYAAEAAEFYKKSKSEIIQKHLEIKKEEPLKREISEFLSFVSRKKFTTDHAAKAKDALELALKIQAKI